MYSKMLEAANEIYADYISSGDQIAEVANKPSLLKLKDVIKLVKKEDFGISDNKQAYSILFCDKNTISYANIHSEKDERFSFGLFFIPKGGCLPLHDHPSMFVYSKILMGKVKRQNFTLKELSVQFEFPIHSLQLKQLLIVQQQQQQLQNQAKQQLLSHQNTNKNEVNGSNNAENPTDNGNALYLQKDQSENQNQAAQQQLLLQQTQLKQNEEEHQSNLNGKALQKDDNQNKHDHQLEANNNNNHNVNQDNSNSQNNNMSTNGNGKTEQQHNQLNFDQNQIEQAIESDVTILRKLSQVNAVLNSEELLEEGWIDDLDPFSKNLHYIEAVEDCVFFDVLLPHYDLQKRFCNYYHICSPPDPKTGDTLLQIMTQPLNKSQVQYFTINKTCSYFN